ncbi:uncharacterized protein LOC123296486 [Chrysoperla carnea]|uniref:uncharacterized protein LOC123296486 n=1 Tax=Chrysoperla carnea TaxID=189513 RepID=UPI001D07EBA6|nr:uncharacterized protein LOC123296486 [Chrysoperla carnea]
MRHFKVLKSIADVDLIPCHTSVGGFAAKLFESESSYAETLTCPRKCPSRFVSLPVMSIRDDSLHDIDQVFVDHMGKRYRCNGNGCTEKTINNNIVIGDIVFFEPYVQSGAAVIKQLDDLCKEFTRPTDGKKMKIVGVVHFYPPTISKQRRVKLNDKRQDGKKLKNDVATENKENVVGESDLKAIGHYVAIGRRTNGLWVMYDDRKTKEKQVSKKFLAEISLLVYAVAK